ncbi:MAG: hypothetical protein RBR34_08415 [Rhodospirillaceae bacterium]|nr:hypothetical protein [Rhodospirillaceae bacterium]
MTKPGPGHNNPPSLFDEVKQRADDVCGEARLWLDGAIIDSRDMADGVANLDATLRKVEKAVDDARKADKQVHLDASRAVDDRYRPLLDGVKSARSACKSAVEPWLLEQATRQEAARENARREAEEKARVAQEAFRQANPANLADREAAEALAKDAKEAERAAARAEKQTAKAGGALGRAVHLRTTYTPEITDYASFMAWVWKNRRQDVEEVADQLALKYIAQGLSNIPGLEVRAEKRVA